MNPSESLEKEPIVCHCADHSRHGEHGTQAAGEENRNIHELLKEQNRPKSAWGQMSLSSLNPKGWDT